MTEKPSDYYEKTVGEVRIDGSDYLPGTCADQKDIGVTPINVGMRTANYRVTKSGTNLITIWQGEPDNSEWYLYETTLEGNYLPGTARYSRGLHRDTIVAMAEALKKTAVPLREKGGSFFDKIKNKLGKSF